MLENNDRPVQIILAGKAHPQDEEGKRAAQGLFGFKRDRSEASRLSFLDNYSLSTALNMVAGCDVWINVPRPPLEASGTSGMKAALNGGLNLSVLDGWWAEAYDGTNGWAIPGDILFDHSHAGLARRVDALRHHRARDHSALLPARRARDTTPAGSNASARRCAPTDLATLRRACSRTTRARCTGSRRRADTFAPPSGGRRCMA